MDTSSLDPSVKKHLPDGAELVSVLEHGETNWSTGYRITIQTPDEQEHEYFIKVIDRERSDEMARGEYESTMELMKYIPESINHPIAWGVFEEDPSLAFYLTRFRKLRSRLPRYSDLLDIVRRLHKNSESPTGKFGFPVTTFYGPPPMDNSWTDSWEEYFTREFKDSVTYAQTQLDDDVELNTLAEEFIEKVIPRLLRPLQMGGRSIKPTLCFGDLWDANVQEDIETKGVVLFDPCCFYGHNEMDLQCMRTPKNRLNQEFIELYKQDLGPSEPTSDFDDRNTLYAMRNDLRTMGMWPQWTKLADRCKYDMRRLLAKHHLGIQGFINAELNARAFNDNAAVDVAAVDTQKAHASSGDKSLRNEGQVPSETKVEV